MEILLVDDQITVVNGLEKGISWESLGISKVHKAYNAVCAKEIIKNRNIDILLCDIEMPEENGLSLCRWIQQNGYDVVCVLLTAYADFNYAKEAVNLGIFDYILQPVRYEEIEKVLRKVRSQIEKKKKLKNFSNLGEQFFNKKQILLDDMVRRWIQEENIGSADTLKELNSLGYQIKNELLTFCVLIHITRWEDEDRRMDDVFAFVTGNILQEMSDGASQVICVGLERDLYACMFMENKGNDRYGRELRDNLETYTEVIYQLCGCRTVSVLGEWTAFEEANKKIAYLKEIYMEAQDSISSGYGNEVCGVYGIDELRVKTVATDNLEPAEEQHNAYIEAVIRYIRCNIEQPLHRRDIANVVNLNEDYLSRLFKRKMGVSLKEFIICEKMTVAKKLLKGTNLPVGSIAAKVGYDNFSLFSSTYRKIMGKNPMEERK